MQYVNLGRSGLKVSRVCLGMMTYGSPAWREWVLPEDAARPIIRRALELGVNFFDTADMYSQGVSEEITGRALREFAKRDEVVIATKVYHPTGKDPNARGLSRKHIMAAFDASLARLGIDYVDLYQIHRWDYGTPIEETLSALHDLVKSGKVRYLGASSMFAWQFARALYLADRLGFERFVAMQNHYNLVYREEEREMLPLCRAEGVGVIPWSPLARGFLAGNRTRGGGDGGVGGGGGDRASSSVGVGMDDGGTVRGKTDEYARRMYDQASDFDVADAVAAVAERRGLPRVQVALAWLFGQPGISAPIVGARSVEQLEQSVAALDVVLSSEECAELEAPYRPHPVLGHE